MQTFGLRLAAAVVACLALAGCSSGGGGDEATATAAAEQAEPGCAGVQEEVGAGTRAGGQVTGVDVGEQCEEARVSTSLAGTAAAHADAVRICSTAVASTAGKVGGVVVVAGDGTVLAVGSAPGDCAPYTG